MNRQVRVLLLAMLTLALVAGAGLAENQVGTLVITGVPPESPAGHYDRQSGIFYADVREIEGALVHVSFDDVELVGKQMEWRTDDNYLIFQHQAELYSADFELSGDVIEYFGDENKLESRGNVVVVTEDATVYADNLIYDEETDEALFTGQVRVVFSDGVLSGERFVMLLEKSELQFFGAFQGEFNTDSN